MIRMEVKGLDELERQLMALGEKVATKVLRDAGREALKVVEEDMKQHAGFDETSAGPHMRDSIKIRSSTRKGKGNAVVTLRVGPSKQHHMKALAQEFGTVKQVADPFIRPALDYNLQTVLRVLTVEIETALKTGSIRCRIKRERNMADKTSPEYAMLPAGTIVKYGEPGAATSALKPLINCKALGAMGQTGALSTAPRYWISRNSPSVICLMGLKSRWASLMIRAIPILPRC